MNLTEKVIRRETRYQGRKLSLEIDDVELPDGTRIDREIVRRRKNAVILALNDKGEALVEEQYRHTVEGPVFSLPAGKQDEGETLLETAKRELREETGFLAREWHPLGKALPAPAYSDEEVSFFLARGLQEGRKSWDPDEFLNVFWMPLSELRRRVEQGEVLDGRTQLCLYRYEIWSKETK